MKELGRKSYVHDYTHLFALFEKAGLTLKRVAICIDMDTPSIRSVLFYGRCLFTEKQKVMLRNLLGMTKEDYFKCFDTFEDDDYYEKKGE